MRRSTVVVAMIAMLVGAVPGVSAQALAEGERIRITERDAGVAAEISQELGESLPTPRKFAGIVGSLDDAPSLIELQNGNIPRRVHTEGGHSDPSSPLCAARQRFLESPPRVPRLPSGPFGHCSGIL